MILITGLTGTSGSAFYKILCQNNYSEKIKVVVRDTTDISIFENSPLNIELVVGDITDTQFLIKALAGCEMIFHIAAKNKTQAIIDAAIASPQVKNLILVSSTSIYSKYYKTSTLKEAEKEYIKLLEKHNKKYVFIRPTMIYGTPKDKNISVFIRWFLKYPIFPIVNHGKADIQPVYRYDLAEAYYLILTNFNNLKQKEYVVSGKEKMTLYEMFTKIIVLSGRKTKLINIPFSFANFLVHSIYFLSFTKIDFREKLYRLTENRAYSCESISKELGYAPHSFEENVKNLIDIIKNK